MLITTEPPRLTSVALVRRYPAEDVRRAQFLFEDEFRHFIRGETTAISASPANPDAPRFMMTDGKRTLVVANTSVQLSLDFGAALPPKLTLNEALARPAVIMDEALARIFDKQTKFYAAIIVTWAATQPDLERLSEELMQWNMKTHFAPKVATYATTIGLQRNKTNRTIEVSQYKSWKRTTTTARETHISVDPDFEEADDQGLQIKIDVNTKPQLLSPPQSAFKSLVPIISDTISVDLENVIGPQLASSLPQ